MTSRPDPYPDLLREAVQAMIQRGFHDPRIGGLITITSVRLLDEENRAILNVSVLPAEKESLSIHGLNAAASFIRREVGSRLRSRGTPKLEFRADHTFKKQREVLEALAKVEAERQARANTEPAVESPAPPKDPQP